MHGITRRQFCQDHILMDGAGRLAHTPAQDKLENVCQYPTCHAPRSQERYSKRQQGFQPHGFDRVPGDQIMSGAASRVVGYTVIRSKSDLYAEVLAVLQ